MDSIVLCVLCVSLFILFMIAQNNYCECKKTLNDSESELTRTRLELRSEKCKKYLLQQFVTSNKDIKEAVQYAMKAAHPDNGGKEEDFIKFRNTYNLIKKSGEI